MSCSPIHLQSDMVVWFNPHIFDLLTQSYRNYTPGDVYDCGLKSVPCASNLTKEIAFSNPTFVFWFDLFTIYVALTALSVIGIIGNVITISIISKHNIANDSTNNIFLWLSVSDLFTAMCCGVLVSVCFLCFIDDATAISAFNLSFPYTLDSIKRFNLLSLDFVTVISIQRAIAVILPFKISQVFTTRNTNIIISTLIVLFIIIQIPTRIAFYPRWVFHPYFQKVISLGYTYRISYRFINDYIGFYYYSRSATNLVLILISVSLTIIKLNIHGKQRSKLKAGGNSNSSDTTTTTNSSKTGTGSTTTATKMSVQEVRVVKMSIAVCVITFIIYTFNMMDAAIIQIYADSLYASPIPSATTNAGILLSGVGSSFNFFLYVTMSTQYREAFFKMFKLRQE